MIIGVNRSRWRVWERLSSRYSNIKSLFNHILCSLDSAPELKGGCDLILGLQGAKESKF